MSRSLCPSLLPVFLLLGGSVVPVKAFDTQNQIHVGCPYDSGCDEMVKLIVAVNEIKISLDKQAACPGVNEKLDKQAEDLKKLKEHLNRNLGSTAFISKQLKTLSADLSRHDDRLKALIESQGADVVEVKLDLLGRTATQSSTFVNPLSSSNCDASLAIDGNYNTDFFAGTCSHTNDSAVGSSWWRVDLGQPFQVKRIMIVNRVDCCGKRLNNFVVGLSNSSAVPVRGQYALCGQYPGPAANGARLSLQCDPFTPSGRYVIVQQSTNGDGHLTICEIEIYVEQLRNHVRKRKSNSGVLASGH